MDCQVLIVEDSPILRRVVRRAVQLAGVADDQIREAEHGKDALDKLAEAPADLILLDLNMPVMDGISFARAKQEMPEFKSIPIIVVTTEGNEAKLNMLSDLGVQGFLRKPFEPEELRALVHQLIEDRS